MYSYHNKNWDKKNNIKKTCENSLCVNIDHLKLAIEIEINYENEWNRLIKKSIVNKNGCRLWTGCISQTNNYGKTRLRNEHYTVHRLSYLISRKLTQIPEIDENGNKLIVRHLCNVRLCFEPNHIELGTFFQNNKEDKIKDGTFLIGEKHHKSSIREKTAIDIKKSKNEYTIIERMKMFSVSRGIISTIDANKSWRHIPNKDGIIIENTEKQKIYKNNNFVWTQEFTNIVQEKLIENTIISEIQSLFVDDKCLLWTKAKNCGNYGYFRVSNRIKGSHIWSYEVNTQTLVSEGFVVRHKCNVRLCCNFNHLEIGTQKNNSLDCINTSSNSSISSIDKVIEIRSTYLIDNLTRKERCEKYYLKNNILRNIENYKTFSHVLVCDVNIKFNTNNSINIVINFDRYNKANPSIENITQTFQEKLIL